MVRFGGNMSFADIDIELSNVRQAIDKMPESLYDWSSVYFEEQKRRYQLDWKLFSQYYSSGKVLEVGALPFHFTSILAQKKVPYVSIDLAPERAQFLVQVEKLNVVKCNIELEDLPFKEEFDFIFFNEIFEHLRINPIEVVGKLYSVLKKDGLIVLTTPNLNEICKRLKHLKGHDFDDPYFEFLKLDRLGHMGHVREYTLSQVCKFLTAKGFEIVNYEFRSFYDFQSIRRKIVYHLFPKFRPFFAVVARKKG